MLLPGKLFLKAGDCQYLWAGRKLLSSFLLGIYKNSSQIVVLVILKVLYFSLLYSLPTPVSSDPSLSDP